MTASTASNTSTAVAERRGISGPVLVAIVFLLTTMTGLAFQTADFVSNQTGVDLQDALRESIEKKTRRDRDRHRDNPKLRSGEAG